jgi:signal transduction histidine kinase
MFASGGIVAVRRRRCLVQKRQLPRPARDLHRRLSDQVLERPREVRLIEVTRQIHDVGDRHACAEEVRRVARALDRASHRVRDPGRAPEVTLGRTQRHLVQLTAQGRRDDPILVPLGHELIRAEGGESAIAAFDEGKTDLVLLDLVMPGVDGIGVLAHIREHSVDDHVPVVVLTAHSEIEHRLLALEAGADDFLEKPADGRSLRARVTTLLQLKDSRDALRRLNDELGSRHAALTHLQREQRDLMAFVVHDLKSPLAAVSSNLGFAQAQMGHDDANVKEALQDAADASRRLSTMIDDLLILSRLEDSELPLHNESIQVSDLLRDVFGEYVRRAAEKHVKLLTPELASSRVVADRGLLQRVIENLLDNSLRYTPEHGRVHIATRANDKVEIAVSKSGPPIPPLERLRIFEKFARVETHTTACGNAGLGLYFCKRAVEALGGDIEVTETPEWPTSFVVHLPASS